MLPRGSLLLLLVGCSVTPPPAPPPRADLPKDEVAAVAEVRWERASFPGSSAADHEQPSYRLQGRVLELHRLASGAQPRFERCTVELGLVEAKRVGPLLDGPGGGDGDESGTWIVRWTGQDGSDAGRDVCACPDEDPLAAQLAQLELRLDDASCAPIEPVATPMPPAPVVLHGGGELRLEPDGRYVVRAYDAEHQERRCEGRVPLESTPERYGLDALWYTLGREAVQRELAASGTLGEWAVLSGQAPPTTLGDRTMYWGTPPFRYPWSDASDEDLALLALHAVLADLDRASGCEAERRMLRR
ncbi:MAG: hypothetical protein RLO52_37305 [Sandaracinaceae bacterium]